MTGAELAAVALVAAWLAVLTLMLLLVIRHVGLLTLAAGGRDSTPRDGLMVGSPVPGEAIELRPDLDVELRYLVFLSGNCSSCAELAPQLGTVAEPERLIAVVAGSNERANRRVAERLPAGIETIVEPDAGALVSALQIHSTPQALQTENGIVTGKATLRRVDDLIGFIAAYATSDAREIAIGAREAAANVG
jgi:hypothetical protein